MTADLPEPACDRGFSADEIAAVAGVDPATVQEFMMMRASPSCHDHGVVYYEVDARQFIERFRH